MSKENIEYRSTNMIFHKGKGVKKRKGIKCPETDMHSKPIIAYAENCFLIYEHYGTWYLEI